MSRWVTLPQSFCERPARYSGNAVKLYVWSRAEGLRRHAWRTTMPFLLFTVQLRIIQGATGLTANQIHAALGELHRFGLVDYDVSPMPVRVTFQVWTEPKKVNLTERPEGIVTGISPGEVDMIIVAWNRKGFTRNVHKMRSPLAAAMTDAVAWLEARGSRHPVTDIVLSIRSYQRCKPQTRRDIMAAFDCPSQQPSLAWFLKSGAFGWQTKWKGK